MIHEHVLTNIQCRKTSPEDFYKLSSQVTEYISVGDVLSRLIYADQNWFLRSGYGLYSCVFPSYALSQYPLKNTNYLNRYTGTNTSSIRGINKNTIIKINSIIDKDLDDLLMYKKLIRFYLNNKNYRAIKEIFSYNNLTDNELIELVKKLLKLDKTSRSKKEEITTKIKNLIIKS
jgi:hypothetical protein